MFSQKAVTEDKLEDLMELGQDKNAYTAGIKDATAKIEELMDDTRDAASSISDLKGDISAHELIVEDLKATSEDGENWAKLNREAEDQQTEQKMRTAKAKELISRIKKNIKENK